MTNNIIDQFKFPAYESTGMVECTDFVDVDRAMLSFIGRIVNAMTVTDTKRAENREFAAFIEKPLNERLYSGYFETPQEFIRTLKSKSNDKTTDIKTLLPSMYLSRDLNISFCDGSDYIDIANAYQICSKEDDKPYANINKSFSKLNYTLTCLAWNKSTCDRIALSILMWLRNIKKRQTGKESNKNPSNTDRLTNFIATTKIAGVTIPQAIEINIIDTMTADSIGMFFDNSRLYGYSFSFEVIAEAFEAEFIIDQSINLQLAVEAINEQY
ncbi:TPA: hypothetical protein ACX6RX_003201 [Photobacterium damselae]